MEITIKKRALELVQNSADPVQRAFLRFLYLADANGRIVLESLNNFAGIENPRARAGAIAELVRLRLIKIERRGVYVLKKEPGLMQDRIKTEIRPKQDTIKTELQQNQDSIKTESNTSQGFSFSEKDTTETKAAPNTDTIATESRQNWNRIETETQQKGMLTDEGAAWARGVNEAQERARRIHEAEKAKENKVLLEKEWNRLDEATQQKYQSFENYKKFRSRQLG